MARILLHLGLLLCLFGMNGCTFDSGNPQSKGWKLVARIGVVNAVVVDSQKVDDDDVYADAVRSLAHDKDSIRIMFFDDNLYAMRRPQMSDDEMKHWIARYNLDRSAALEEFVRLTVTDSSSSPPVIEERMVPLGFSVL